MPLLLGVFSIVANTVITAIDCPLFFKNILSRNLVKNIKYCNYYLIYDFGVRLVNFTRRVCGCNYSRRPPVSHTFLFLHRTAITTKS